MKLVPGNRITLYKNGAALFPAIIAALDAATVDIRVEAYIFKDDSAGEMIADALSRAARRGVAVRMLIDGFGSTQTPEHFFSPMQAAGVSLLFYRPARGQWFPTRHRLQRLHRKIVLVDGKVGFTGGINFIDDFNQNFSLTHPRLDYAVGFEGPVLTEIYESVFRLWRTTKWFTDLRMQHGGTLPLVSDNAVGATTLAFVTRDNLRHRRSIERQYRLAIAGAQRSVLIACPYFLPGKRLRDALMDAAQRGVVVEVLLQGVADYPLLQLATRSMYGNFLAAGVVIYEYQPSMLHAKVAVVDDCWATVGSSNLDPFSLLLNREANIIAQDAAFAATLRASLRDEIDRNAIRLDAVAWRQRSLLRRIASWLALALLRLVSAPFGVPRD